MCEKVNINKDNQQLFQSYKQYLNTAYYINPEGKCYSTKSNKLLKPQMTQDYPTYNLTYPNGKKKKTKIHRMVAETFIPNPENKPIVNHIDGNTKNFHCDNLEWVTEKENSRHAVNTGLRKNGDQTINKFIENLPNEIWASIDEFPNYIISSEGRIMNIGTKRLLKFYLDKRGYYTVNLWKQNRGHTKQIHPLVYSIFNEDYNLDNFVINHKDGNKLNNRLANLEKITSQENNLHAVYSIKTNKCNKAVYQILDNQIINTYNSINEAEKILNIHNISRACRKGGKAGGYYWRYKD